MRIEFLETQRDAYHKGGGNNRPRRSDSGLFWWTILITILFGLATFCWFFSIYVFSHPEKPLNYDLLTRLGKLPEVEQFAPNNVPTGKFKSAKDLYNRFYRFAPAHLKVKNDVLKRDFIRNYKESQPLYITGTFEVISARELTGTDPVTSGCVVRMRCADFPNVDLEYIVPATEVVTIPVEVGETFKVSGSGHFASVVHIDRFAAENICFSVIPLIYPDFKNTPEEGGEEFKVAMTAPEILNMNSQWPCTLGQSTPQNAAGDRRDPGADGDGVASSD